MKQKGYTTGTYICRKLRKVSGTNICTTCKKCKDRTICNNRKDLSKCKKCKNCKDTKNCDKFYLFHRSDFLCIKVGKSFKVAVNSFNEYVSKRKVLSEVNE